MSVMDVPSQFSRESNVLPMPVLGRVGRATYRQLDYWVRAGYLFVEVERPGSGFARDWPPTELEVAALMAELVAIGFTLELSATLARERIERGTTHQVLSQHPTVVVEIK